MIDYIHTQLSIWGRWVQRGALKGKGYSPICPMFKDAQHGGGYGSAPPPGIGIGNIDDILDMNAAVGMLDIKQRQLAMEFYVVGGSGVDVAKRFGVSRKTLYEKIHLLHQKVLFNVQEIDLKN